MDLFTSTRKELEKQKSQKNSRIAGNLFHKEDPPFDSKRHDGQSQEVAGIFKLFCWRMRVIFIPTCLFCPWHLTVRPPSYQKEATYFYNL
jgi:hypothetical protein